jgi:hypothetical protein
MLNSFIIACMDKEKSENKSRIRLYTEGQKIDSAPDSSVLNFYSNLRMYELTIFATETRLTYYLSYLPAFLVFGKRI